MTLGLHMFMYLSSSLFPVISFFNMGVVSVISSSIALFRDSFELINE